MDYHNIKKRYLSKLGFCFYKFRPNMSKPLAILKNTPSETFENNIYPINTYNDSKGSYYLKHHKQQNI